MKRSREGNDRRAPRKKRAAADSVVALERFVQTRKQKLAADVDAAEDVFTALCMPYGLEEIISLYGHDDDTRPFFRALTARMPFKLALRAIDLVERMIHMNDELARIERFVLARAAHRTAAAPRAG